MGEFGNFGLKNVFRDNVESGLRAKERIYLQLREHYKALPGGCMGNCSMKTGLYLLTFRRMDGNLTEAYNSNLLHRIAAGI